MKDYLKLLKFLKGHQKLFSIAVVTMFVSGFFEVFQLTLIVPVIDIIFTKKKIVAPDNFPEFINLIISKLNSADPKSLLYAAPFVIIGMLFLKGVFLFIHKYFMSEVSQRVMRDVRFKLYQTIQHLSLDYFSKKRTGELISRITNDVSAIENATSYGLTDLFQQSFVIIACVITAFAIYPAGALIIFLVFPLIGFPMSRIGKRLKKISRGSQEKMADINTHLLETISGIKLVKAFNNEEFEINKFKGQNHDYYKLMISSIKRIILISPLSELVGGIFGSIVLLTLGQKVFNEEISFGLFTLFFGCIMSIISPTKKLGNVNALLQQAMAANERIYEVLDKTPTVVEKKDAVDVPELHGSIVLKDVKFKYDQDTSLVLNGINIEVKKGELVAIVGPTGTGKTTLINLIPRFYDPSEGEVIFDDINLKNITFKSLRKQIGYVTQESILFNDSVRNNICYGKMDATDSEVEDAARKAFAHRFIKDMPQGYDTLVGDRGFRLSGGEKQRLSIARAILLNPPILLLDEATSSLDSESEKFVQEALDELMEGRTVIAIAHRLSTIKKADKIVVLDKGKVVGVGKHEKLIFECELYNRLNQMQFQI